MRGKLLGALACALMIAASPGAANAGELSSLDIGNVLRKMSDAKLAAQRARRDAQRAEQEAKSSSEQKAAKQEVETATTELRSLTAAETYIKEGTTSPENLEEVKEVIARLSSNVWVTCQGTPWMTADANEQFGPIFASHIEQIRRMTRAVGRIARYDLNHAGAIVRVHGYLGTAVAIGRRQVITNKHVILKGGLAYVDVADGSKYKVRTNVAGGIEFPVEYDRCNPPPAAVKNRVKIVAVDYVDPNLDFAVVSVDSDLDSFVSFPPTADVVQGDRVAVIGYPARPDDTSGFLTPLKVDQIFRTPDGRTPFLVQRIAEGDALPRTEDVPAGYIRYDASTGGGNSGSLVMSLATGQIIGLHAGGQESPVDGAGYNEAVDASCISAAISEGNILASQQ